MRLRLRIVVKQGDAEKGRVLVEDARCLVEEAENRRRNEEVVFEDQKMAVLVLVEYLVKYKNVVTKDLQKRRFCYRVVELQDRHFLRHS